MARNSDASSGSFRAIAPARAGIGSGSTRGRVRAGPTARREPARRNAGGEESWPLTPGQQRLWRACQSHPPAGLAFAESCTLHFSGPVDAGALAAATREVLRRHAALRSVFSRDGSTRTVRPAPLPGGTTLAERDLPPSAEEWQRWLHEEVLPALDPGRGPLASFHLLHAPDDARLVFAWHQLAGDDALRDAVIRDLASAYADALAGREILHDGAPAPAPRAADGATARMSADGGRDASGAVAGACATLPSDRARPVAPAGRAGHFLQNLPGSLIDPVRALARELAVGADAILLAGFALWIHRFSRRRRLRIGLRSPDGYLDFAVAIDPATSFAGLARQVHALRHAPAGPVEDRALAWPLQVFSLRSTPPQPRFGGQECRVTPNPVSHLCGELALEAVEEAAGGISLTWRFNTDLFLPDTIRRWHEHLVVLLGNACRTPNVAAGRLSLLGAEPQSLALTPADLATGESDALPDLVHRALEAQAARRPQKSAVIDGTSVLSYELLDARANRLARHLVALGANRERCVALLLPPGEAFSVALLAVLKSGAAAMPLDPIWTAEEIAGALQLGQARVLVTASPSPVTEAGPGIAVVDLEAEQEFLDRLPRTAPLLAIDPGQAALILLGGRASGTPRGLRISHRAAAAHLAALTQALELTEHLRIHLLHPAGAPAAVEYLLAALGAGAAVVCGDDAPSDAEELTQLLHASEANTLALPAADWTRIAADAQARPALRPPEALARVLLVGSECPGSRETRLEFPSVHPTRVIHGFAPDALGLTITLRAGAEHPGADAADPNARSGRPHAGTVALVLDDYGQSCPLGVPGELCLGGTASGLEFVGSAAASENDFIAHPSEPGTRLLRTGELVRILPDGTLEHFGRIGVQPSPATGVPLGGKVDACFGEPWLRDADAASASSESKCPADASAIARAFAAALGVDQFGIHENFFDAGGDSLRALRALACLNREHGTRFLLAQMLEHPSAAALATQASHGVAPGPDCTVVSPPSHDVEGRLTAGQAALWCFARLHPDDTCNHVHAAVRLLGDIDRAALSAAVDDLVARHPALRTRFFERLGTPVQVVQDVVPARVLQYRELAHVLPADREGAARRLLASVLDRPFMLEHDVLLRALLVRIGSGEHALILVTHAIVADAWSVDQLLGELAAGYRAHVAGEDRSSGSATAGLRPLAEAEASWLAAPAAAAASEFWRRQLADAPRELPLPRDVIQPSPLPAPAGRHRVEIGPGVWEDIRRLAAREQATTGMALLSAFALLLRRWTGADDVVIGTPAPLRDRPEHSANIAPLMNLLPVRIRPGDGRLWADLLRETRETVPELLAHGDYPFAAGVDQPGPAQGPQSPAFQVVFALEDAGGQPPDWGRLHAESIELAASTTRHKLELRARPGPAGLRLDFVYARTCFAPSTIAGLARELIEILTSGGSASTTEREPPPPHGDAPAAGSRIAPAPPSNGRVAAPLEVRLREICRDAAGVDLNRPHESFLDRGGSPLRALCVLAHLEQEFGVRPDLRTWLERPTLATLAALVRRGRTKPLAGRVVPDDAVLVPVQPHGDQPPLFFFPASGGADDCHVITAALVREWGSTRPVFCVRLPPLGNSLESPDAGEYGAIIRAEMRRVDPDGPYHLAGEGRGGLLAYEVARQLREAQQPVAFLGLFDCRCPLPGEPWFWRVHGLPVITLLRRHARCIVASLLHSVRGWRRMRRGNVHGTTGRDLPDRAAAVAAEEAIRLAALSRYRPRPADVVATIFASRSFPGGMQVRRWARHAGAGVELVRLPGDHASYLRNDAGTTARHLRACLDAAGSGEARTGTRWVLRNAGFGRKRLVAAS